MDFPEIRKGLPCGHGIAARCRRSYREDLQDVLGGPKGLFRRSWRISRVALVGSSHQVEASLADAKPMGWSVGESLIVLWFFASSTLLR